MLKTLLYKELRSTVGTFQFQFITIVSIVICSAYVYIGLKDYETRLENYNVIQLQNSEELSDLNVFSDLQPQISIRPKVLSTLSVGTLGELGTNVRISPFNVPSKLESEITYNPYISSGFQFDFNKVVAIFLSLLAILISFNVISEEHENGTLKLVLSNGVPKWKIIMSKLIACQIAVSIALILILIISFLILLFSASVSLSLDHIFRIFLIFIFYQLYLSCFILFGAFFSIQTKKSSTSLIIGLFIWLIFTMVIPYSVMFITESSLKLEIPDEVNSQIKDNNKITQTKLDDWRKDHPTPGAAYTFGYISFYEMDNRFMTRGVRPEYLDWCEDYFSYRNQLMISSAEKNYEYEKVLLRDQDEKRKLGLRLASISITNQLCHAVENLCSTSIYDYKSFLDNARSYRLNILSYLNSHKAFSSRKWFTDDPIDAEPWVVDPYNFDANELANDPKIGYKAYLAINVHKNAPERKLNLVDVPGFIETSISIGQSFNNSLVIFLNLLLIVGLFFFLTITFFNKFYIVS